MPEASHITALLGPTNTGKTHRAVEAMLAHPTGMIGLPLRLLAREVYDRVTARIGEERVALITGEEKRVPRHPEYWICTVEAMPLDREVDFLAVDEIQLAAHPQRGHVFTERLLHARGRRETMFLGSDAMRPLMRDLVPTALLSEHARLSSLKFAGTERFTKLRGRTAVVAFSTPHVYELAERLKRAHGGVAVVLGALSPRTRNAQVAMFQAGEVSHLVATDAIGMGLNLAVEHVAFASLRKFDGREMRELDTGELAQIAGRAGRYRTDGTFGTLAPLALHPDIAADIEAHRFAPVRRLVWRNADLEFDSVDALLASLRRPPRMRALRLVEEPDDTAALALMMQLPAVRARAQGAEAVRLLWDVCTVPDYKKLLLEAHVGLLAELYAQLSGPRGRLDADWIATRVREIDDTQGDIDTLMARIAAIRTWTYVTHRPGWVPDAVVWQERAREVEDRLSDALHARLVQRFVERTRGHVPAATARPRSRHRTAAEVPAPSAPVVAPTHPFARLAALRDALAPPPAPTEPDDDWLEAAIEAPHAEFVLDAAGTVFHRDQPLGALVRGSRLLLPDVALADLGDLGAGDHARLQRRLVAFARDAVHELLAPLRSLATAPLSGAAKQLVAQLEQHLGTVATSDVGDALRSLTARDRHLLRAAGVEIGGRVVYLPALLKRAAIERRCALCSAHFERAERPAWPRAGAVSIPVEPHADPAVYTLLGYPACGTRAVRADVIERVARALAAPPRDQPDIARLATWLGCPAGEVAWVVDAIVAPPREASARAQRR